jgi:hypothetical protein
VVFQRVSGHRDGDATSCPGNALYRQLGDLRVRADGYAAPVSGITVTTSAYQRGARPVALAGVLRFADGTSPSEATLSIEFTAGGAAWTPVGEALCGPDGRWETSAVLPSSGRVRAVFGGDAARPPVASPPIPVTVVPQLTLSSPRRTPVGGRIAVSGTVAPAPARVRVTLERRVGRRWVRVGRRRSVAVVGGRYATSVRLGRAGLYRVSVAAGGAVKRRNLRAV